MNTQLEVFWHKAVSLGCELYLRVDTRGAVQPPNEEGVHYTPLPYPMIFKMLHSLAMTGDDVFVDVGCGKGRVVCCACRLPIRKTVALELNPHLLDLAMRNARRVRGRQSEVEPVERSAEEYDYSDATVVYLYNPFNARLTELVLERLFASYARSPRPFRVVYANPVHEASLMKRGWLQKYDEWPANDFPVFGYPVSFWQAR